MSSRNDAVRALLESGVIDWVSAHAVVWEATQFDLSEVSRQRTRQVLEDLFDGDLMVPGDLKEAGFTVWPLAKEHWVDHAMRELDRLNWRPMGDGFWLAITERGEERLRVE
jgi:hypothetical protein